MPRICLEVSLQMNKKSSNTRKTLGLPPSRSANAKIFLRYARYGSGMAINTHGFLGPGPSEGLSALKERKRIKVLKREKLQKNNSTKLRKQR